MRSVSSRLIVCLIVLSPIWACAQTRFGPEITYELPRGHMAISPSAEQVVIIGPFNGVIFSISEDMLIWEGPYEFEGGFYSTENGVRKLKSMSSMGWVHEPDGTEVYIIEPDTKRAATVKNRSIEYRIATGDLLTEYIEQSTGRLLFPRLGMGKEYFDARISLYQDIRGRSASLPGFVSRGEIRSELLPETIVGLGDISPQGDRLLCRTREDTLLGILNLHTGTETPLQIQNGRDRALPGDMGGSFSPDGEYVLMQYSYGPDDHYAGGYLQLFTKDGQFVEEVAEFRKDVSQPVGFHEWLNNNWIVYSNGKELIFQKFIATP